MDMVHRHPRLADRRGVLSAVDLTALSALLGHRPRDEALFVAALTHGSHLQKRNDSASYERLEFLGDRVLGLAIAGALYERFPNEPEGQLSLRLNTLVSRQRCATVARELGLPPLIRLGRQAHDDGGRDSDNILGDVVEALIGALYRDAGFAAAEAFVLRAWADHLDAPAGATKHPKAALLEWAARAKRKPPEYRLIDRSGPDHAPRFTVTVTVAGGEASGSGSSKGEAETRAAAARLEQLESKA